MSDIKLDTEHLADYGRLCEKAQSKINAFNRDLKQLYGQTPITDLGKLIKADIAADCSIIIGNCAGYCFDVADTFNQVEINLSKANPLDFNKPAVAGIQEFFYDAGINIGNAVSAGIDFIESNVPFAKEVIEFIKEHGSDILEVLGDIKSIIGIGLAVSALFAGGGLGAFVLAIVGGAFALSSLVERLCGTNPFEYAFVGVGALIGLVAGNANAGAKWGEVVYSGIKDCLNIPNLIKHLASGDVWASANDIGHAVSGTCELDERIQDALTNSNNENNDFFKAVEINTTHDYDSAESDYKYRYSSINGASGASGGGGGGGGSGGC